jgi:hypothetical protein
MCSAAYLCTHSRPKQALAKKLLTNKEIIRINQDPDVVAGSLIYTAGRNPWATDLWVRPLSDGSFAVLLVNKDPASALTIAVAIGGFGVACDFSGGPAGGQTGASVRDVYTQTDLGNHTAWFNTTVPAMDARLLRFNIV